VVTIYEVVVATDRALVIMRASIWRPAAPKEVLRRVPRGWRIRHDPRALWSDTNLPGDHTTWVNRRFYKDVEKANAACTDEPSTSEA
jgi:hypothetical protein